VAWPGRRPIQAQPAAERAVISEDGRPIRDDGAVHPPLPEFDPRFVQELEAPGGAVKLRDRFYVERDDDARLKRQIVQSGTTTTIRAARQTGKTSLLMRGIYHARQAGAQVAFVDLQKMGSDRLKEPDLFLRDLAESVARQLRLDPVRVAAMWQGMLGPQEKLTSLMEEYVLAEAKGQVVLALDEADRLLRTGYDYQDFFALIRSWHNNRAYDDLWNKLNIAMVISTEPYLLIRDVTQSPFNVGLQLYLTDFTDAQVRDLNGRHGSPVQDADFPRLMELLSGHPYLTRKALYTLVTERMSWADLERVAATDQGPFADHLRHHHWLLLDRPELQEALRQILRHERCADETAFFRLLRSGLVKGSGDVCRCRCDLYRIYFKDKL
jgi:AAA-like domain